MVGLTQKIPNPMDTIGNDDERSVIIDDYALVLPTGTEILAFFATGIPGGWNPVRDLLGSWNK